MDDYNIIIKPLITEQGMHFANAKGAYSFEVNKRANKAQIKNAVERIYNVKVQKVELQIEKASIVAEAGLLARQRAGKKLLCFWIPIFI